MADLKEEFGKFKKTIRRKRRKNMLSINLSLFEDPGMENFIADSVADFLKRKRVSKKEMIRFYITEMTGLTEEEFNEHFMDGKKTKEKKIVSDAVRDAVGYKLKCDLENVIENKIKRADES